MNAQADISSKRKLSASSFTPSSKVLQRKCACGGGAAGLSGECEECSNKKSMPNHASHLLGEQYATLSPARGELRSPALPLEAGARLSMGSHFGHDFSRVRVHARMSEALPSPSSDANSTQHLTIKGQLLGDESSSSEETSETFAESPEDAVGEPLDSPVETGTSKCPVTAVFSSTLAGKEKANCQVPEKQFGAATLARFVLHGVKAGAGSQTVNEQFKKLKDDYGVFRLLKPNTYTTSGNIFDDCYMLASPDPLPSDLELQVEQNHLLNGQIISKNIITYTPSRISIRSCKRVRGKCDFASVCRR